MNDFLAALKQFWRRERVLILGVAITVLDLYYQGLKWQAMIPIVVTFVIRQMVVPNNEQDLVSALDKLPPGKFNVATFSTLPDPEPHDHGDHEDPEAFHGGG